MLLNSHKIVLGLLFIATLATVIFNFIGTSDSFKLVYSNIAQIILSFVASFFLFLAWKQQSIKSSERKAWFLFGLGMLLWGIGNLVYYLHALNNSEPGIVFYGYLFFYGMYLCFIIAYVLLALDMSYNLSNNSIIVATIIFILAIFSSLFFGLFTPIAVTEFIFSALFGALSPVFMASAVLFSANGLTDPRRSKLTWGLMLAGTVCFFIAERGTLLLIRNESYYSGSLIDAMWLLSLTLLSAAGMSSYARNRSKK